MPSRFFSRVSKIMRITFATIVLSSLFALPAQAVCPPEGVAGAIAARIDGEFAKEMVAPLIDAIPPSFLLPEEEILVLDAPIGFDDTIITPRDGIVYILIEEAELSFNDDGEIILDVYMDIEGHATLDMILTGVEDAICPAHFQARHLHMVARMQPSVNDTCDLILPITFFEVVVNPYSTVVQIEDCGTADIYDDLWQMAYSFFRDEIINMTIEEIETVVRDEIPATIEEMSNGILADGMELYGMYFQVGFESLMVNSQEVELSLMVSATAPGVPPACIDTRKPPPDLLESGPAYIDSDAPIALSASQPFLQSVLNAAWGAGWLCMDSRDFDLDFSSYLDPLFPGARMDFSITSPLAPLLRMGSSYEGEHFELAIQPLVADLWVQIPESPVSSFRMYGNATLGVAASLDDDLQALIGSPTTLRTGDLTLDTSAGPLQFSRENLDGFVRHLVLPAFAEYVGPLPLTSSLFVVSTVALSLDEIRAKSTQLELDFDAWSIDGNDHSPPSTLMDALPAKPSLPRVTLQMRSIDDTTESEYLRHWVKIDGEEEESPRSGTTIILSGLSGGWHSVELRAVDLAANEDLTPVFLEIFVDAVAPVLELHNPPIGVIPENSATIDFSAFDNITESSQLEYSYTVAVIARVSAPDSILYAGQIEPGKSLRVVDLPEDEIIRVTIFATDEAGNQGSIDLGFGVNASPTLSCSTQALPSHLLYSLFAVLAFGWVASRRRRDY